MKRNVGMVLILLLIFVFSGCGEDSASGDNDMVKDFIDKMYAEDWNGATVYISPDIAESLTAADLSRIVKDTTGAYGAFSAVNDVVESNTQYFLDSIGVDANSVSRDIQNYDIYYASISFEKGDMGIFFMVDPEDHLLYGLTVCGSESDDGYHSHGGQVHKH